MSKIKNKNIRSHSLVRCFKLVTEERKLVSTFYIDILCRQNSMLITDWSWNGFSAHMNGNQFPLKDVLILMIYFKSDLWWSRVISSLSSIKWYILRKIYSGQWYISTHFQRSRQNHDHFQNSKILKRGWFFHLIIFHIYQCQVALCSKGMGGVWNLDLTYFSNDVVVAIAYIPQYEESQICTKFSTTPKWLAYILYKNGTF